MASVALWDLRNGLYCLDAKTLSRYTKLTSFPEVNSVHITSTPLSKAMLWHKKLGHFHNQGLRQMIGSGVVTGLPSITISNNPCMSCLEDKQSSKSIPKVRTIHTTRIITTCSLRHCWPIQSQLVKLLGQTMYFITSLTIFPRRLGSTSSLVKVSFFACFRFFIVKLRMRPERSCYFFAKIIGANILHRNSPLIVQILVFIGNIPNLTSRNTMV